MQNNVGHLNILKFIAETQRLLNYCLETIVTDRMTDGRSKLKLKLSVKAGTNE